MKFLKLTLVAILSLTLLTAVLPSTEPEPAEETSNHDIKEVNVELSSILNVKPKTKTPSNG